MSEKQLRALHALSLKPWLLKAHVDISDSCWPCVLSKNKSGYASVRVGPTSLLAHRAAYWLANGPFDLKMNVCHSCDNPACCNPSHLFLGTHADNMQDMRKKGRRQGLGAGETNGRAKLDESDVLSIRGRRTCGEPLKSLSASFGVGMSTISRVCRMENWK